jgi:hypothetical protein
MSMFDKLKDAAENALEEHGDVVKKAIDKAEDVVDQRTGGKYHDQIESAGDRAATFVDSRADDGPLPPTDPGH